MNFTDEQIMNCTLMSLKHLRIMYTYLTEEAGTPEFFEVADECMQEITTLQRNTYLYRSTSNAIISPEE